MDTAAEEFFHLHSRGAADLLQALAALADDDRLLAVALDPDRGGDAAQLPDQLKGLDFDSAGIGHFIAQLTHQLLTHELARQVTLAAISQGIGLEQGLALGQQRRQALTGILGALFATCTDHQDDSEIMQLANLVDERQQLGLVFQQIDLVDDQGNRQSGLLGMRQRGLVPRLPDAGLDDQRDQIDLRHGLVDGPIHGLVHGGGATLLDSRRVDEGDLTTVKGTHTQQPLTGGVRLGRDRAQMGADKGIEQARLADIGTTHQGRESGAVADSGIH